MAINNLVAYYKMEGNGNDSVGSNNGTATSVTFNSTNGKIGQGAGYNGTTSKITGSIAQPTSAYTIWAWVSNAGFAVTDTNYRIWDTQEDSGAGVNTGVVIAYNPNTSGGGTHNIRVYHNNGLWSASNDLGSLLDDGKLHLVMIVWNGSNHTFYVDGIQKGSPSYSTTITNGGHFNIGNSRTGSAHWLGNIDEMGVASSAYSSADALSLFNFGSAKTYPFSTNGFFAAAR